jgi:uncharacterized cupin superfamily protein
MRPVANLFDVALTKDDDPAGYNASYARVGPLVGAEKLGVSVYELPPGESICPYHFEVTEEEWLLVLAGAPVVRTPEGERTLEPGDVVCFPAGEAGAHKVTGGEEQARVAIWSSKSAVGVSVYPDSQKLGVWFQGRHHMVRLEPQLDYWDGETESRNAAT